MTLINIPWPNQSSMVLALFKTDLPGGAPSALLHAAVGISGEVAELIDANSHGHMVEELGDTEFYFEALMQQTNYRVDVLPGANMMSLNEIFHGLVVVSGTILDLTKKHWAYNKPLDLEKLEREIDAFKVYIDALYFLLNVDRTYVIRANMVKLATRYASGSYSDAEAQDRADKVEEGDND